MTNMPDLFLVANAFFTWLFTNVPEVAVALIGVWVIWYLSGVFRKFEFRLSKVESDLVVLKSDVKELKIAVGALDKRIGRLEGQLEFVIHLLKEKSPTMI